MRSKLFFILILLWLFAACKDNPYGKGMRIYQQHCAVCHADDGNGLQGLIPPIRQSDYLAQHQDDLACIIRHGLSEPITVNNQLYDMQKMPPNDKLNEIAITNLINFISNAWGNQADFVTVEKIKEDLGRCSTGE